MDQVQAAAARRPRRGLGNVKKVDFLMSRDRDLQGPPEGARMRYLLCSTARSGSTLVGDMLAGTGAAGDPQEYLNGRLMAGYARSEPTQGDAKMRVGAYVKALEARRTSPNGVFGLKVHFEHIQALWGTRMPQAAKFLSRFDKFILLSRRDKAAQAVSLHKARETQIWTSLDYQFLEPDDPRLAVKPQFEPMKIAKAFSDIVIQEESWRQVLTALKLPYIEVVYEDVVADYAKESRRVLDHLGLADATFTAPTLKKQGQDNDPMVEQFKRYAGLAA